jgi:hypothetical protein
MTTSRPCSGSAREPQIRGAGADCRRGFGGDPRHELAREPAERPGIFERPGRQERTKGTISGQPSAWQLHLRRLQIAAGLAMIDVIR